MSGEGTERFMTEADKLAWRRREIVTLLAYPNVGPLTAPAIRIDLGAGEVEVQTALQAFLADRAVTRPGRSTYRPGGTARSPRLPTRSLPASRH